ncbi:ester cyclase [Streptomyces cylindrosporus]|uniref:Ester cyclase n=1 Tax=Streptomyces cylindrosporus TaxID=2927583 RepID=A0ABS9YEH4_9ACTN|nr:ester cyclase [Streptomyces cylindrosporus]MCI3274930.1 ester cyclase [Streptomyces cylindrosporus]
MTTARRRLRLIVPTALAALAVTATTAAAHTAPTSAAAHAVTTHTHQEPTMNTKDTQAMLDAWIQVWNGDFAQAPGIISPGFRVHAALLDGGDGSSVRGVDGLVAWIGQTRAAFPDLRFSAQVEPLIDGHYASVRWTATGTYAGGFPGARAEPGTAVTFTGTDTLRIRDGKFVEYWLNSDTLELLKQLQVV